MTSNSDYNPSERLLAAGATIRFWETLMRYVTSRRGPNGPAV